VQPGAPELGGCGCETIAGGTAVAAKAGVGEVGESRQAGFQLVFRTFWITGNVKGSATVL
jgi:hypothetical protein